MRRAEAARRRSRPAPTSPGLHDLHDDGSICEFLVALGGVTSCAQVCATMGGECIEVWDDVGDTCQHLAALTCQTMNGDSLCSCSHGCGGGPACSGGQPCSGGTCS